MEGFLGNELPATQARGGLDSWLRLLNFDTFYDYGYCDTISNPTPKARGNEI
jgi:hypothetical protein